ncbi:Arc family DNA-binding protein [Actinacidiphila oryziradicis]|jgi:plasmid stability protein|uniref:Arc family DNA-binding protein n=1 Tax=Actinacidiphila oryziradicis TaxID=2571141 RepID=A0A4U0S7C5_9ACTN|nr:Arc family DNA-binding protein [Actinacidiphila oryziradicis]TKA04952.1 Arc family DNA-binding protein [Actinacidiphila oryziradicis]
MIRFALRLPDDLHQQLTDRARTDRRSINSEILHLLEVALSTPAANAESPADDSATSAPLRRKPDSSPA